MRKILFILAVLVFFGCEKESLNENKPKEYSVKFTIYSMNPHFKFVYLDKDNIWHEDLINQSNYTQTMYLIYENRNYCYMVKNLERLPKDSVHLKIECDGRMVQNGTALKNSWSNLNLNLVEIIPANYGGN